jgi:hypothetical protein
MINKPFGAAFSFIYYPLVNGDPINPTFLTICPAKRPPEMDPEP